jgi:hypothetical protein
VFTSGIVSTGQGRKIALYFTGRQHAGENIADVLKQRAKDLSPVIQMCDALSRNPPKLPSGVEILVANCLAHGRRQFVEVVQSFPEGCRHVLEMLGEVYRHDAAAREGGLTAEERLRFHQEHSGPVMEKLHGWLEAQFAERKTEPNSGLGKAITYLLRHWKALTTFLREAGTPLDNNVVTAVSGSADVMPTPGLCRVGLLAYPHSRRFSDSCGRAYRHNHKLSRKASKVSRGRKRAGTSLDGLACANARSLSSMSA